MALCKVCSKLITNDKIDCDGICGQSFHASCLKRSYKISFTGSTTCGECSDIKPCHILRLVKSITETLSNEQSFIADKVNSISANCAGFQLLSDDLSAFSGKLDKLIDAAASFNSNSSTLLSKLHDVSNRMTGISASVEDLRASLAGCDLSSAYVGNAHGPILPAFEDISRSVTQIKADFGSWSAVVSKNSDAISAIASDVKDLLLRHNSINPTSKEPPKLVEATSINPPSSRRRRRRRLAANVKPTQPCSMESSPSRGPISDALSPSIMTSSHDVDAALDGPTDSSAELRPAMDVTEAFDTVALRPAVLPRCVFISRIHPDTSVNDVVCHISSHLGISRDSVACKRIDRLRNGAGSFSASFKVIIPDALFHTITSPEIWPGGTIVREFIPRNPSGSKTAPKNLSAKLPSTMQI